jgi:hypothetical protein
MLSRANIRSPHLVAVFLRAASITLDAASGLTNAEHQPIYDKAYRYVFPDPRPRKGGSVNDKASTTRV